MGRPHVLCAVQRKDRVDVVRRRLQAPSGAAHLAVSKRIARQHHAVTRAGPKDLRVLGDGAVVLADLEVLLAHQQRLPLALEERLRLAGGVEADLLAVDIPAVALSVRHRPGDGGVVAVEERAWIAGIDGASSGKLGALEMPAPPQSAQRKSAQPNGRQRWRGRRESVAHMTIH